MKKVKVGPGFSDFVISGKSSFIKSVNFKNKESKMRSYFFPLLIFLVAILILVRLLILQVIEGTYYKNLSDNNRIRTTILHAPRGIIFDRNGKALVYNIPGFREVINGKVKLLDNNTAISLLSQGKNLDIDTLRNYPYKGIFSHVIGYVGQISAQELKLSNFQEYTADSLVGKMGIEKQYEGILSGTEGKKLTEVDSSGKAVKTLGITDPIPGQNITLTLDANLQEAVFNAMRDVSRGAAIVSTPKGEILAMVSKPSFDPNLFTMGNSYKADIGSSSAYTNVEQILLDNTNQPLLNRAISGQYPPGSTFKPVVAAAALQTNTIDENYQVNDTGILKIGDFSFANWYYTDYGRTEGLLNVVGAIKRSNDIFFYKLGNLLGVDKLSENAKKFGLGNLTGIDLPGEEPGFIPTSEWKKKVIGDKWYLGDDYHYGIGQGYLLVTPLQVNLWTQAIANAGTIYKPYLLKNMGSMISDKNLLNEKNFDLIRQGMIEACSPGGVGWPLFNFAVKNEKLKVDGQDFYTPNASISAGENNVGISIACKTGTAEHGGPTTPPDAWITIFAPAFNPQIIVTVLSEDSGEGSNVAGPIAKEILTKYFENLK